MTNDPAGLPVPLGSPPPSPPPSEPAASTAEARGRPNRTPNPNPNPNPNPRPRNQVIGTFGIKEAAAAEAAEEGEAGFQLLVVNFAGTTVTLDGCLVSDTIDAVAGGARTARWKGAG